MNADQRDRKADAIKATAAELRERTGGRLTQRQAETRVERAVNRGDRDRGQS